MLSRTVLQISGNVAGVFVQIYATVYGYCYEIMLVACASSLLVALASILDARRRFVRGKNDRL
jgi:hypothetical protein